MSTVLNDLILTDATGFTAGDSLAPGAGLTGTADSGVVTSWGDPALLAEGDTLTLEEFPQIVEF